MESPAIQLTKKSEEFSGNVSIPIISYVKLTLSDCVNTQFYNFSLRVQQKFLPSQLSTYLVRSHKCHERNHRELIAIVET